MRTASISITCILTKPLDLNNLFRGVSDAQLLERAQGIFSVRLLTDFLVGAVVGLFEGAQACHTILPPEGAAIPGKDHGLGPLRRMLLVRLSLYDPLVV